MFVLNCDLVILQSFFGLTSESSHIWQVQTVTQPLSWSTWLFHICTHVIATAVAALAKITLLSHLWFPSEEDEMEKNIKLWSSSCLTVLSLVPFFCRQPGIGFSEWSVVRGPQVLRTCSELIHFEGVAHQNETQPHVSPQPWWLFIQGFHNCHRDWVSSQVGHALPIRGLTSSLNKTKFRWASCHVIWAVHSAEGQSKEQTQLLTTGYLPAMSKPQLLCAGSPPGLPWIFYSSSELLTKCYWLNWRGSGCESLGSWWWWVLKTANMSEIHE